MEVEEGNIMEVGSGTQSENESDTKARITANKLSLSALSILAAGNITKAFSRFCQINVINFNKYKISNISSAHSHWIVLTNCRL